MPRGVKVSGRSSCLSMSQFGMESEVSGASDLINEARAKVRAMVERETRRTGSKMAGYHAVASMIGRTPEWLRAFCCNYEHVSLDITVMNIHEAYRRAGNADGAS